jgi:Zn-dependent peptidase ImmA (M78 family)
MAFTAEAIQAIIAAKRQLHPELARALTWTGVQRICEREGVILRKASGPTPRPAQLVPFAGAWTILLSRDVPQRRYTYLAAHELGHLWLHHDAAAERWEHVFNMDVNWPDDPREDEAETFAALVLAGPTRARAMLPPEAESHLAFALRTVRRTPIRRFR